MKTTRAALLLGFLAATSGQAAEPAAAKPDVVAFNASVRVEVDAAGKPVKVEAPADLPEAIRGYIEKRVASWQYQPAKADGAPASAVTYVDVNACAMPANGGYRIGLDFGGNGPRRAGDKPLPPPDYPPQAQISGTEADFVLILDLQADGTARIGMIESNDIRGRGGRTELQQELKRWVKTVRFDLEQVAGRPVPARVRVPVDFSLGRPDRKALRAELQAKALATRECQQASNGDGTKPVAMDSPAVVVTPKAAG